jgi:hypothetical protein
MGANLFRISKQIDLECDTAARRCATSICGNVAIGFYTSTVIGTTAGQQFGWSALLMHQVGRERTVGGGGQFTMSLNTLIFIWLIGLTAVS